MALRSLNDPPKVPNGVRTADKNTTSRAWPWVFTGSPKGVLWLKDDRSPRRWELPRARVPERALADAVLAHATCDPVAHLASPEGAADVSRTDAFTERRVHGALDGACRVECAKVAEHHSERENGRHRIRHVLPRERWGAAVHGLVHRDAARVPVGARRQTESADEHRCEIRQDVAEQVAGDDDLKRLRRANQIHRHGVDVPRVALNAGILAADLLEHAPPQMMGLNRVGFVGHRHVRFAVVVGPREGVADDALHALARVELLGDRDFVLRSLLERSADGHVQPFGILAEDDEVEIAGRFALERR